MADPSCSRLASMLIRRLADTFMLSFGRHAASGVRSWLSLGRRAMNRRLSRVHSPAPQQLEVTFRGALCTTHSRSVQDHGRRNGAPSTSSPVIPKLADKCLRYSVTPTRRANGSQCRGCGRTRPARMSDAYVRDRPSAEDNTDSVTARRRGCTSVV